MTPTHVLVVVKLCLTGFGLLTTAELNFAEPGVLVDGTNAPKFVISENDSVFPDQQDAVKRLQNAFIDMIIMAGVACVTFGQNEEVYQRYFGEPNSNPDLVKCKSSSCIVCSYCASCG